MTCERSWPAISPTPMSRASPVDSVTQSWWVCAFRGRRARRQDDDGRVSHPHVLRVIDRAAREAVTVNAAGPPALTHARPVRAPCREAGCDPACTQGRRSDGCLLTDSQLTHSRDDCDADSRGVNDPGQLAAPHREPTLGSFTPRSVSPFDVPRLPGRHKTPPLIGSARPALLTANRACAIAFQAEMRRVRRAR